MGSAAESAAPALVQLIKDQTPYVRKAATEAIDKIGTGKAVTSALEEALNDDDPRVRIYSAMRLSRIKPSKLIVPALITALKHRDGLTRQKATYALADRSAPVLSMRPP